MLVAEGEVFIWVYISSICICSSKWQQRDDLKKKKFTVNRLFLVEWEVEILQFKFHHVPPVCGGGRDCNMSVWISPCTSCLWWRERLHNFYLDSPCTSCLWLEERLQYYCLDFTVYLLFVVEGQIARYLFRFHREPPVYGGGRDCNISV